jgi:hypothetical protein
MDRYVRLGRTAARWTPLFSHRNATLCAFMVCAAVGIECPTAQLAEKLASSDTEEFLLASLAEGGSVSACSFRQDFSSTTLSLEG